jgi:hypothetical protein
MLLLLLVDRAQLFDVAAADAAGRAVSRAGIAINHVQSNCGGAWPKRTARDEK